MNKLGLIFSWNEINHSHFRYAIFAFMALLIKQIILVIWIITINVYMGMKIDYMLSKGQKLPPGSTKFGRIWNMNHKDISNSIHVIVFFLKYLNV